MPTVDITSRCSDLIGEQQDPEGDAATCYALFSNSLVPSVEESSIFDVQNLHLYVAARDAAEDAMDSDDWPAGYTIDLVAVTFSRQSAGGWDRDGLGAALALRLGDAKVHYFSAETLSSIS
ncbi:MAG: hypothetical protein NXI31_01775 [bacterium]|nr:hypothetical protein [bacterium]